MQKTILNKYSYVLENIDSKELLHIHEIIVPKKKVISTSQNPGGYGASSHQRSVLEEVDEVNSLSDYKNNIYSSKNPVCEKLLNLEKKLDTVDSFKVVLNHKEKKILKQYKILSKTLRNDS